MALPGSCNYGRHRPAQRWVTSDGRTGRAPLNGLRAARRIHPSHSCDWSCHANSVPLSTALISILMLAALAFADGEHTANKWRIELDGQALKTGDMQFRVTPSQGEPVDIVATIKSGRAENNVAKDVRDAFAAKLSPERLHRRSRRRRGHPDQEEGWPAGLRARAHRVDVRNVNIKIEGE